MEISSIALAGGRGSRLGRDKLLEFIGTESLIHRVVSCLSTFNGEIIIVKAENQSLPAFDYPKLKIVADIYPDKGPLGGLYTGLVESGSLYNLVVAGDMPFLSRALLSYMIELTDGFDLVVPRLGEMVEPLHAIYSKSCLSPIRHLLTNNELRVSQLLTMLKVRYVEAYEIDRFDPERLSFFNINTEADVERAKYIASRSKSHDKC